MAGKGADAGEGGDELVLGEGVGGGGRGEEGEGGGESGDGGELELGIGVGGRGTDGGRRSGHGRRTQGRHGKMVWTGAHTHTGLGLVWRG